MGLLPSGTVTFLFTDIEGSTKLAQQYPDALSDLLTRHHEILHRSIHAQNGYVFQIVGDAFCAAFSSAGEALNAALDAQQCLYDEALLPVPVKVRMGIHTGTAQLTGDGTPLVYLMGNYLPQFWVPGAAGATITGLFIHDLVGLFVTPIGWGLMYFFVPILLRKPIWSHALSLIGFWGIAFFYPILGVHHFLLSPIPMYAQYGAIVATIAVEIVVFTVLVNFAGTLHGRADAIRGNLAIRWFYTGMLMYGITCLQCAFQVTLTFQKVIHFTDWVVGHAHMVMFGVFGFWIFGFFVELWPRVVGRGISSGW